jgi:hypothetical protein
MKRNLSLLIFILLFHANTWSQTKASWQKAAEKAFYNEDYSTASSLYLSALEYDENDPYLMLMVGECNRRMFEYNTAIVWFNRSIVEDKDHHYPENYYRKAETHLARGETDEARKMLNNFLYADSSSKAIGQSATLMRNIDSAEVLLRAHDTTDIAAAGKNVNTAFSDFAATILNDSTMLFSSLRFELQGSKKKEYVSMILKARIDSTEIERAAVLPAEINNPSWHNCNASVSPDGKIMVFSRCNYDKNNKLVCKLYESLYINNKWQQPVALSGDINNAGFTSTQPCITSAGISGYHLFFVSDRTGGKGFTDIYYSLRNAQGDYSTASSCSFNTAGREVTPFYNPLTGILYFSSDSLIGLGAYDIYKTNFKDQGFAAVNIGLPFNSGYNDVYYTEDLKNSGHGFLSSNRPGTLEMNGSVCCYDVFRFMPSPPVMETAAIQSPDSIQVIPVNPDEVSSIINRPEESLRELLPLKLYFDNDYPDPRSRSSATKAGYQDLYTDYSAKLEKYIEGFSSDKSRNADDARDAIEKFFITELQYNYKQLDRFCEQLLKTLNEGYAVTVTVQGFASPLAESRYNLILSARRIASIINYWTRWNGNELAVYLSSGKLTVKEEPSGERDNLEISDKLDDKANSVYNPSAARERRIEVINVAVSKP